MAQPSAEATPKAGSSGGAASAGQASAANMSTATRSSSAGGAGGASGGSGAAGASTSAVAGQSATEAGSSAAAGTSSSATAGVGGMSSAGASGTPAADGGAPMASPGCMGGTLKPGRTMGSIDSSGGNRTYIQYVPMGYDGQKPLPLFVDLHPFSVGASFAESSSGFRQLADTEGYVYLAPQGQGNMWDSVGDMDEKFIRDLVNQTTATGCIDLRRVYASGCSNGGAFSFLLMCTAEDIFAAVAPMCGTAFFDIQNECMMDRPMSFMLRIGMQDTLNCWEGEGMTLDAPNVEPGTKIQCAKTLQKIFGDKYHCKGQPMKQDECEFLGECDGGIEIAICDEPTGHVVYQANTAKDTWAFLKKFYKP
jgi:polyhydroxybutyrate depolymerase